MSKSVEITMCVDSFNRDKKSYPNSADFVVTLPGRFQTSAVVLGGLELPAPYNVEHDWASGHFDAGVKAPLRLQERTLAFTPHDTLHTVNHVILPAAALACTATEVGQDYVEWTTAEPHGLSQRALEYVSPGVAWGMVVSPRPPKDTDRVFAVTAVNKIRTADGVPSVGQFGCLVLQGGGVRAFSTPSQLAVVASLNFSNLNIPLELAYDSGSMQLILRNTRDQLYARLGACDSPLLPCHAASDFSISNTADAQVLSFLHFRIPGQQNAFPLRSGTFPEAQMFTLLPGQYTEQALRLAVEGQLDGSRNGQLQATSLRISVIAGDSTTSATFSIAARNVVTPVQIAQAFTAQLSAAWPASHLPSDALVSLGWTSDQRFTLSSAYPFAVTWGVEANQSEQTWQRLGFEFALSPATLHVGAKRTWSTLPTEITLPTIYKGQSLNSTHRYVLQPEPRVQAWPPPDLTLRNSPYIDLHQEADGTLWSDAVLPPEYIVQVNGGTAFARASRFGVRPSGQNEEALFYELVSGFAAPGPGVHQALPLLVHGAVVNMYFPTPPGASWSRLAEIMGFNQAANLWPWPTAGPNLHFQAPARWNLELPAYVLIDVGLQHMSANMLQRCREDLRTSFLAKVPFYSSGRTMERSYSMQRTGSASVISELRITLLTPWHSLLPLGNREWSCTLILGTGTTAAQTLCP